MLRNTHCGNRSNTLTLTTQLFIKNMYVEDIENAKIVNNNLEDGLQLINITWKTKHMCLELYV